MKWRGRKMYYSLMRIQGKNWKDILTNIRKFVRKRAYLTILDKHPSAIFWPFSLLLSGNRLAWWSMSRLAFWTYWQLPCLTNRCWSQILALTEPAHLEPMQWMPSTESLNLSKYSRFVTFSAHISCDVIILSAGIMYLKNAFKNLKHFIFRFIHFDITFTGPAYISFCLYGAISFDKKHGSMMV